MRSEALKKSQMNPKILMMKKNERIDKNNQSTFEQFKGTSIKMRADAARYLEQLRDPFMKPFIEIPNNYEEMRVLKSTIST